MTQVQETIIRQFVAQNTGKRPAKGFRHIANVLMTKNTVQFSYRKGGLMDMDNQHIHIQVTYDAGPDIYNVKIIRTICLSVVNTLEFEGLYFDQLDVETLAQSLLH